MHIAHAHAHKRWFKTRRKPKPRNKKKGNERYIHCRMTRMYALRHTFDESIADDKNNKTFRNVWFSWRFYLLLFACELDIHIHCWLCIGIHCEKDYSTRSYRCTRPASTPNIFECFRQLCVCNFSQSHWEYDFSRIWALPVDSKFIKFISWSLYLYAFSFRIDSLCKDIVWSISLPIQPVLLFHQQLKQ